VLNRMRRPDPARRGKARELLAHSAAQVARGPRLVGALVKRAQQWLSARERSVRHWFAHFPVRTEPKVLERRQGGAGAILLPFWWEYESELKCRLALEALLRRLFSMVPTAVA
jgi:hypothetical protein